MSLRIKFKSNLQSINYAYVAIFKLLVYFIVCQYVLSLVLILLNFKIKNMKKLVLSVILLISVIAVKAQGGIQNPPMPPAERANALLTNERFAQFAFSGDQISKIKVLLTKFYTSSDSLMATLPQEGDRRAAMQEIMSKRTAMAAPIEQTIVAMLSAEQKKVYDTMLATAKERNPNATAVFTGGYGGRPRN